MRKLFLALMAVAAIALTGCENPKNEGDPNPPENIGMDDIICSCGNEYTFTRLPEGVGRQIVMKNQSDYKVYASGFGGGGSLSLVRDDYPFVTYKESVKLEAYFFWRCACGRYHKVMKNNGTHTEIPAGQQPEEWNEFSYLWE